jgi:beta-lactamase superfamily II metal-dependent hydrolase
VSDEPGSLAAAYKRWVGRAPGGADPAEFGQDRPGPGAAKNDQSIVIRVAADGWSALLPGDMQFAKAEVPGLTQEMKALRRKVTAAGPYDFVKFSHHTSYNGVDESVMEDFGSTRLFAHTGGLHDSSHPDPDVLQLLEGLRRPLTFARTDHNGLIRVAKVAGKLRMTASRGELNDFTPNPGVDEPEVSSTSGGGTSFRVAQ